MTSDDETQFLEFAKQTGEVVVLAATSPTDVFEPVTSLTQDKNPGSRNWERYFLFNRNVSMRPYSSRSLDSDSNYFFLNSSRSSVVEFARCRVLGNIMCYGRIWADFRSYNPGTHMFLEKEPGFKEWYETLEKWIRKSYKAIRLYDPGRSKVPSWILYAAPGIEDFVKRGGRLSPNPDLPRPGVKALVIDLQGSKSTVDNPRTS